MSLKSVVKALKKQNNFLITAHAGPEGDAIGSELGLFYLLKKLGKKALIINQDALPYGMDFLPGAAKIRQLKNVSGRINFDCLVTLDSSDLSRVGKVACLDTEGKPVINIDHHFSNTNFGTYNWVEGNASSASEMVYRLFKETKVAIGREAAMALYVGILTDTGSFRYSNTSRFTHQAAAELLACGIDVVQVYKQCYENIPFADMKTLAVMLAGITREAAGRIIWCQIPRTLLKKNIDTFDLGEHILSFCRAIKGVEVVALFRELPGERGQVRVNFRSQGKVDVNKVASNFSGGGHKTAAGATVKGSLVSVRKKVLQRIRKSLK
jgi:bifunctional oligoribonuclease and PAP phosphatase NrnA